MAADVGPTVGREHLVASGKDADVFVRPDGLLVKRCRAGTSLEPEAELLRYLRSWQVPVPNVVHASGDELVMEYVTGPTMAAELNAHPWRARSMGRCLAGMHRRLDRVPAPSWLRHTCPGDRLLHLDLHPGNVVLGPNGPVVVDWANAGSGDRGVDVALSWLTLAITQVRLRHRGLRWVLLHAFAAGVDRTALRAALPTAAEFRLARRERDPEERIFVQRLVEHYGGSPCPAESPGTAEADPR